jgi:hypothetical protein
MTISYSKLFVGISLPALCTGLAGLILCSSANAQTIRPSTQKELKVFDPTASATGNVGIRAAAGTVSYTLTLPAAAPSENQVLSANAVSGGTVSLTWATPFSGTGTTNYLSKFASAGTLTNSQVFDNGTYVGIGTATPTYKLDVNGGNTTQANARFYSSSSITSSIIIGGEANSFFSNLVLLSNSGSVEIWKSGTDQLTWGGAKSLNIYNSNGAIAFHPNDKQNAMFLNTIGNVGIGTTSPGTALHVYRETEAAVIKAQTTSTTSYASQDAQSSSGSAALYHFSEAYPSRNQYIANTGLLESTAGSLNISAASNNSIQFWTNNHATPRMVILGNGKVSVGDTDPVGRFEVKANSTDNEVLEVEDNSEVSLFRVSRNGDIRAGMLTGIGTRALYVTSAGVLTTSSSDARLKTNIEVIPNALQKVMGLRGVTYNWKDGRDTTRVLGMIAQEMLKVAPELVFQNNNGYYGIHYAETTGLLVEAIKEQQKVIEQLKAEQTATSSLLRQLQLDLQSIQKPNTVHKE